MDIASLIISIITILAIVVTSIVKPTFSIKNKTFSFYWLIALTGAVILLASTILPFDYFVSNLTANEGMNPLKILILFISMTCLSIYLDEMGFFSHLANFALKKCKSSQIKIFIAFYILVSILTMFTSNDIVILTMTPFIIHFCKRGNVSPIPYLVSEFITANTWSMMFIIGNPTNIYIASSYEVDFISYFLVMAIPTLLAGLVEFFILLFVFYKKLSTPITYVEEELPHMNNTLLIMGLTMLGICTILLVISSYVPFLEMYYVSFGCLFILTLMVLIYSAIKKRKPIYLLNTYKRGPYELIPFLLSMFVIALSMKYYGFTDKIHSLFGENIPNIIYGYSSLLCSNLVNNIPMSVLFSNIISGLEGRTLNYAIYSTIIGSNIGAFLTPIGALAGIMWMNILKKHEIHFTFLDFVKYGLSIGVVVASVAIFALTLFVK